MKDVVCHVHRIYDFAFAFTVKCSRSQILCDFLCAKEIPIALNFFRPRGEEKEGNYKKTDLFIF